VNQEALHAKLAQDQGVIEWNELQRHFARGVLIVVATDLDLADIAARVADDDTASIAAWMAAGRLVRASDEHARRWTAAGEQSLRAVVVAPWVLVQELR
jgi:hypothetical protein